MRLYNNALMLIFVALFLIVASIVVISEDKSNKISGNVVNTHVEVLPVSSKNCSFHLNPGWNMVSFYCLGLFSDRSTVLGSIDGYYGSIFEYNSNDATDPWKSYNPDLPNWTVQKLTYLDRTVGYWIYIKNGTYTLTDNSTNVSTTYDGAFFYFNGTFKYSTISVYPGWNIVGYPNFHSVNVSDFLDGVPYYIIATYENDTWYVNTNNDSDNFNVMMPYHGYWLNVSDNEQIIVN